MNLIKYKENKFFLIKKKLKFLIEVTLENDGSFNVSTKLALLLTQSGLYDNVPIYEFLNEYFSFIELIDEEDIITTKSFLVSFLFIFSKKNRKTKIFVFNPFYNSNLNMVLKYNLIDFYVKNKFFLNNYNIKNKFIKKKMFLDIYFDYVINLRKKISLFRKKRFSFLYLKRKKFYFKYVIFKLRKRKNNLRRKHVCKKKIYKKYLKFLFIIKSKKWLDYYVFFKLIILTSYYFSDDYLYLKLKLSLYSFLSFSSLYKGWFIKKLKRRFNFKRKFSRNKYGELLLIIRPIIISKKKKDKWLIVNLFLF